MAKSLALFRCFAGKNIRYVYTILSDYKLYKHIV